MKLLFIIFLFLLLSPSLFAQNGMDYYNRASPGAKGFEHHNAESLLKQYGDVRILNRWYFGVNGFLRTDKNSLSNTFDGLIGTQPVSTAYGFSANVGHVYREQWTSEIEYSRSPIHNVLLINGDLPKSYKIVNDKNSILLRAKRRMLFGKATIRRSALWLGAGAGIVPNSGKQKEYWEFAGYRVLSRRMGVDTLFMTSETRTNSRMTAALEVSAEYVVKISKDVDLSFFGRRQWGLGNSLSTNLVYFVNGEQRQTARITGDGTGWNFGVSLRYIMHLGYDFSGLYQRGAKGL